MERIERDGDRSGTVHRRGAGEPSANHRHDGGLLFGGAFICVRFLPCSGCMLVLLSCSPTFSTGEERTHAKSSFLFPPAPPLFLWLPRFLLVFFLGQFDAGMMGHRSKRSRMSTGSSSSGGEVGNITEVVAVL